ncbi:diguanylate cyclase (GGDEF)-like protein [Sphingomonas jinjuensis]|uniref:diguanylate cyclase n=1 Tax=Sphingomonas jinjuensis TaxID=535907 RepID=A0A840F5J1_9SPHN|nr:GGDEF domain-containing protein [Sphingomonas jinjuensis]MBB4154543.1 diguanylate cyclase (GGDEF)-like protein [Sphingomonas jinjuensis]
MAFRFQPAVHPDADTTRLWLVAATLYFVAAAATIHLTSDGRDIATIWPANAILLALLLADEKPRWLTVLSAGFVGNVVANYITRGTVSAPLLYSVANLVEVAIAARLIGRSCPSGGLLLTTSGTMRFIVAAGLIAPCVSGVIGATTAFLVSGEPIDRSFLVWLLSDGLGLVVFTPVFLAIFRGEFIDCFRSKTWAMRGETLALLGLTAMISYAVFFVAERPLLFVLFPPIMLVTFRLGRLGTKAAVVIVALIGGVATADAHGPIAMLAVGPAAQAHLFQAFIGVLLLTLLPIAAEVTERARLTAALAEHDKEMMEKAITDPLTGLFNRAGFDQMVARAFHRRDDAPPVSLIAIDLDHFKTINDRWGHQAGDLALGHLTRLLNAEVRANDVIGRLGGDEFMVLLPGSDLAQANLVAQRIAAAVRQWPLAIDETNVTMLSLSIGVATAAPGEAFADLARRADAALYAAKAAGRNAIRLAS